MALFPLLESGGGVLRRSGLPGRGPVFSSAALWGYGEFFVSFAWIFLDLLLCGKQNVGSHAHLAMFSISSVLAPAFFVAVCERSDFLGRSLLSAFLILLSLGFSRICSCILVRQFFAYVMEHGVAPSCSCAALILVTLIL